ncbi:MAG TPA: SRPBCC domain-containing protein [Candidatus Limnocylindrales bacterium]|jgi:uncharacterized protein YndB with AHSA1/START domain
MTTQLVDTDTAPGGETVAIRQFGNDRTTAYADGTLFVMERVFDAPRELVWDVITNPDRIGRWWGRHHTVTIVEEQDVRVGGRWRYVSRAPDRADVPFKGEFLELDPPARLVYTFTVDIPGMSDVVGVITTTLEDVDGQTRLVETSRFDSVEQLDEQVGVGMVDGALEQWDRLADEIARG